LLQNVPILTAELLGILYLKMRAKIGTRFDNNQAFAKHGATLPSSCSRMQKKSHFSLATDCTTSQVGSASSHKRAIVLFRFSRSNVASGFQENDLLILLFEPAMRTA
jgi:hypothetical protein